MLTELGKKIDEHSDNFNKELENIKKNPSELKNNWNKSTLEGITSRLGNRELTSDLEDDRVMEISQLEEQKEKHILKHEDILRDPQRQH